MRLSDFKDEAAITVVADLIEPIVKIAQNPLNRDTEGKTTVEAAMAFLKNSPKEIMEILAILSGDKENYTCNAVTVVHDVIEMLSDPDLVQLFGLQTKMKP